MGYLSLWHLHWCLNQGPNELGHGGNLVGHGVCSSGGSTYVSACGVVCLKA